MKRNLLLALSVIGIAISSYLLYAKLTSTPLYCGYSKGCDIVQNSKYSNFFGIPMGFWGMIYYFTLFALIYLYDQLETTRAQSITRILTKLTIIWGLIFSMYLTALEEFVIGAYCTWCIASFINVILIAVISLLPNDAFKLKKEK